MPRESGPCCPLSARTDDRGDSLCMGAVHDRLHRQAERKWSVVHSHQSATLADGLQLGAAIRRARDAARTEHLESGLVTRVEMHNADVIVPLAHYQAAQDTWTGAIA